MSERSRRRARHQLLSVDEVQLARQSRDESKEFFSVMGYDPRSLLVANGVVFHTFPKDSQTTSYSVEDPRDFKRLYYLDQAGLNITAFVQGVTPTDQFTSSCYYARRDGHYKKPFRCVEDALVSRCLFFDHDYFGVDLPILLDCLKRWGMLNLVMAITQTSPGHYQSFWKKPLHLYPNAIQNASQAICRSLRLPKFPEFGTKYEVATTSGDIVLVRGSEVVWRLGWNDGHHVWVSNQLNEHHRWMVYPEDVPLKVTGQIPVNWNDPQRGDVQQQCTQLDSLYNGFEQSIGSFLRADPACFASPLRTAKVPGYSGCKLVYSNPNARVLTPELGIRLCARLEYKDGRTKPFLPLDEMYEHRPAPRRPELKVVSPLSTCDRPVTVFEEYVELSSTRNMSVVKQTGATTHTGVPGSPEQLAARHGLSLPGPDITGQRCDLIRVLTRFANQYGDISDPVFVEWWWQTNVRPALVGRSSKDLNSAGVDAQKATYLGHIRTTLRRQTKGLLPDQKGSPRVSKHYVAEAIFRHIKSGFDGGSIVGPDFSDISKALDLVASALAFHGGVRLGTQCGVVTTWLFIHSKKCEKILGERYTLVLGLLQACRVVGDGGVLLPLLDRSEYYVRPGFKKTPGDYRGMCKEWVINLPLQTDGKTLEFRVANWGQKEAKTLAALTPPPDLRNRIIQGLVTPREIKSFLAPGLNIHATDIDQHTVDAFIFDVKLDERQWVLDFFDEQQIKYHLLL